MATASLILGMLSFATLPVAAAFAYVDVEFIKSVKTGFFVSAISIGVLALVLGGRAKTLIRRSEGRLIGENRATPGMVWGALGAGAWSLPFVLSPIAFLLPHRFPGPGNVALGSLRVIDQAAAAYACSYGRGYPPTLESLGPPKSHWFHAAGPSGRAAGFITEKLSSGLLSGYRVTYSAGPTDREGKIQTYTVRADPINPDTGSLHYFTDQSGVIRASEKVPDASSDPVAGPEDRDCSSGNFAGLARPFPVTREGEKSK